MRENELARPRDDRAGAKVPSLRNGLHEHRTKGKVWDGQEVSESHLIQTFLLEGSQQGVGPADLSLVAASHGRGPTL